MTQNFFVLKILIILRNVQNQWHFKKISLKTLTYMSEYVFSVHTFKQIPALWPYDERESYRSNEKAQQSASFSWVLLKANVVASTSTDLDARSLNVCLYAVIFCQSNKCLKPTLEGIIVNSFNIQYRPSDNLKAHTRTQSHTEPQLAARRRKQMECSTSQNDKTHILVCTTHPLPGLFVALIIKSAASLLRPLPGRWLLLGNLFIHLSFSSKPSRQLPPTFVATRNRAQRGVFCVGRVVIVGSDNIFPFSHI